MLWDVVRFHCALQGHFLGIYAVDRDAHWPVVVRGLGRFREKGARRMQGRWCELVG